MGFWLTSLIFFLSVHQNYAQHDYFTSISGLEKLLAAEGNLLIQLEEFLKTFEQKLININNFVEDNNAYIEDVNKETYENPLSALKALIRIGIVWFDMESALLDNKTAVLEEIYAIAQENLTAPASVEDLNGAAEAISRLQFTYNLKSEDLADGILNEKKVCSSMSAEDCFAMAYHMYNVKKFQNANEWFFIAKNKLEQEQENETYTFPYVTEDVILTRLVPSLISSGNLKLAEKLNAKLHHIQPQEATKEYDILIKEQFIKARQSPTNANSWTEPTEEPLSKKVCSGELHQTPREQRNLRCRYVCNWKPNCIISPLKFEEFSLDPFVGYFYDVIYENEIQTIRNATETDLIRSAVGQNGNISKIRTSKNTWLNFEDYTALRNFGHRMLDMTGLDLLNRELLQVANYGIGGHYSPHMDPFDDDEKKEDVEEKVPTVFDEIGNRIYTALFYINNVDLGGATAFPFLKIKAPPIKGSALVWYNLHTDLSIDYRTWHTGCPVISGSKWIVTQWFHSFGQEFLRPCDLKPNQIPSLPLRKKIDEQYLLRLD